MRRIIALLIAVSLIFALSACSKVPEGEVTTKEETFSVVNNFEEQTTGSEDETESSSQGNIKIITQSYYEDNGNYASLENVRFDNERISARLYGSVDVKVLKKASGSEEMRIAYKAYDANGELVRDTFIKATYKGLWLGKTVKGVRFNVPYEAVRVEFCNYTEQ